MKTPDEISNSENIIDSRDVIARIEYLEYLKEDETVEWEGTNEAEELEKLQALADEASGADDWSYGATLIRDSYFTEYVQELCKDIGDLPAELPWYIEAHIDWDGVATDIAQDYISVDFDGVTYWVR